jgi:hypothetical protein
MEIKMKVLQKIATMANQEDRKANSQACNMSHPLPLLTSVVPFHHSPS